VNTRGNRWHDGHADDRLVYSPYYPQHDGWAAYTKERCVDNAVGLDGQQRCRCARQSEVQSKVEVPGGPPATEAEADVQVEHRLNLVRSCETDRENGYEIDHWFLAMSDPL